MISKKPSDLVTADEMTRISKAAVTDALNESRRMGVPIPVEVDGLTKYELPDGTIVDSDPWLGKNTAPEGWYERWGITPPQ